MKKLIPAAIVLAVLLAGALSQAARNAPVEACVAQHTNANSDIDMTEYRQAYAECE